MLSIEILAGRTKYFIILEQNTFISNLEISKNYPLTFARQHAEPIPFKIQIKINLFQAYVPIEMTI